MGNSIEIKAGCGTLDEEQVMEQLPSQLDELADRTSILFCKGFVAGLMFVAMRSGDMMGASAMEYAENAYRVAVDQVERDIIAGFLQKELSESSDSMRSLIAQIKNN